MGCDDIPSATVTSIAQLVETVAKDAAGWEPVRPWFRGEPGGTNSPLTPMVFRVPRNQYHFDNSPKTGFHYDENNLLQTFRRRAHLTGLPIVPTRHETDKWLFLARHVGLPTRLLDWSESSLVGVYFALLEEEPVVWMLNPCELNRKSAPGSLPNVFPLTWSQPEGMVNIGFANVQAAWRQGQGELPLPVAIEPTTIHPRMNAQHSYFTVHGSDGRPLCEQVGPSCLRRYLLDMPSLADRDRAFGELRRLGVSHSTIMPDAEALATELSRRMVVPD